MQYSPKLKKAAEEIKDILSKYDIAALVVMHTPGFTEFVVKLDPTYSCVKIENGNYVRFRTKLEDFNGDKEAWERKTTDSLEMIHNISMVAGENALPLIDLANTLSLMLDAEHSTGGFTDHTTQNN